MTENLTSTPSNLPPLRRDHSFWGMTATQFLGAFNDNLFKQLVLLICLDYVRPGELDLQPVALALFAIPFVLFSGFGGWFSDRYSKQTIVVLCKVAEITIMLAGMIAFFAGGLWPLFIVLFFMSTQSAFFGPAKYGVLPEVLRERDLPQANGVIQMTTFMAIIFGVAAAGFAKETFQETLWTVSGICVLIAVLGTLTSLLLRRTPIAHARLPFSLSALAINRETWSLLRSDRELFGVLMISSLFWFIGGVVHPTVNAFGKSQMSLSDSRTGLLAACMGVGIAFGCAWAGKASHQQVSFRLVKVGAWGVVGCLCALVGLGAHIGPNFIGVSTFASTSFAAVFWPNTVEEFTARFLLIGLGLFAGLFVVPLQVFLQARPPQDQKGRTIGAMNLINWIGILLAAAFTYVCSAVFTPQHISWTFLALAVFMLPVAVFYRPRDESLNDQSGN